MQFVITRSLAAALVALLVLVVGSFDVRAEEADKPMIVKIHADWCGTCTKLNATMAELESRVGGEATIVVLDVSDRDAVARSSAEADRLGIRAFFDEYKGKTGTVGVLTASGEPVSVMKGELDTEKYVVALAQAQGA